MERTAKEAPQREVVTTTDLIELVTHNEWVPAELTLEKLVQQLNQTTVSYVAVVDDAQVVGVISRESIGLLFGNRYGFSLFAAEPVTSRMEPNYLAVRRSCPVLDVLNAALNREDPDFKTDVVLLDDSGKYLGMIPVHLLARLQSRILQDHLKELQIEKERYVDLVENANDIIFTTDLKGNFMSLNHAGERATGYSIQDETRLGIFDVVVPEYHQLVRQVTQQKLSGSSRTTYEIEIIARDERRLTLEVSSRLILQDAKPIGIHGVARDITERKQAEARLRHNALHDPLTGLPNRTLFFSHLETASEHKKCRPEHNFAVLLVDLDRFKRVNDSLGHLAGDRLLTAITERLKRCIRYTDTLGRFGGDEFTILLNGIANAQEAIDVTERIICAFDEPFTIDGHEFFSSASIGIAVSLTDADPEELIRNADIAMYLAKFSGKGRYQLFDPAVHQRKTNLLTVETDLRRAMERAEFEVYYQPIVAMTNRTIVAFEALVRWHHPIRGLVGPAEFIPVAEETGLILPLGIWVLRQACFQLRKWLDQGLNCGALGVSVNLSVKQFAQPDLVDVVTQTLHDSQLPARCLNLEITESALVENAPVAHATLSRLKELGVGLSTDDFGTGYSSLSYLHRFPISCLKIDRSFIGSMDTNADSAEIVRSILMLGNSLGLDVIAEGVETNEQVQILRELGCQQAQGFLFSRPVTSKEAAVLLSESAKATHANFTELSSIRNISNLRWKDEAVAFRSNS
jgi:diguanylate cyclase (GGDEF)-like protein/PAS domain S-box-containing protein